MAMIEHPIAFSEEAQQLIAATVARPDFSHALWDSEELLPLRREIRSFYRRAQNLNCPYCLDPVGAEQAMAAHVEHIASKSIYPRYMFEPRNLCVVCPECNVAKLDREVLAAPLVVGRIRQRYPERSEDFRIVHPHLDTYSTHIKRAKFLYFDLTPKGAYTIYVCHLGRYLHTVGMTEALFNDLALVAERHRFHRC